MIETLSSPKVAAGRERLLRSFIASGRRLLLERPRSSKEQAELIVELTANHDDGLSRRARRQAYEVIGDFHSMDQNSVEALRFFDLALTCDVDSNEVQELDRALFGRAMALIRLSRNAEGREALRLAMRTSDSRKRQARWVLARRILFEEAHENKNYESALTYSYKILIPDNIIAHPLVWCDVLIGQCQIIRGVDPAAYLLAMRRLRNVSESLSVAHIRIVITDFLARQRFFESRSPEAYALSVEFYKYFLNEGFLHLATFRAGVLTYMSMREPFVSQFPYWKSVTKKHLRRIPNHSIARHYLLRSCILMANHAGDARLVRMYLKQYERSLSEDRFTPGWRDQIRSFRAFALERLKDYDASIQAWQEVIRDFEGTQAKHLAWSASSQLAYVAVVAGRLDVARECYRKMPRGAYGILNDDEIKNRMRTNKHTTDLSTRTLSEDSARIQSHTGMTLLKRSQSIFELQAMIDAKHRKLQTLQRFTSSDAPNLVAIMHDLKNALASIQMLALSDSAIRLTPASRRVLEAVSGTLQWLSGMLYRTTEAPPTLADISTKQASSQSLDDLLTNAISVSLPVAQQRGLRIRLHLPDDAPRQISDDKARMIRSAIFNAITNAVKYAERGSMVHVGRKRVSSADVIFVNNRADRLPKSAMSAFTEPSSDVDREVLERLALQGQSGLGASLIRHFCDQLSVQLRVGDDLGIVRLSLAIPLQ